MKYTYKKNLLKIINNNKEINLEFEDNIEEILSFDMEENIIIIMIDCINTYNIFAVNELGKIIWQIEKYNNSTNKYIDIENFTCNEFIAYDTNHFKYIINIKTGNIIKRLKPLQSLKKNKISTDFIRTIILFIIILISILFTLNICKKIVYFANNTKFSMNQYIKIEKIKEIEKNDNNTNMIKEEELPPQIDLIQKVESINLDNESNIESENLKENIEEIKEKNNKKNILPEVLDSRITEEIKEQYPDSKYPGVDIVVDGISNIIKKENEENSNYIKAEYLKSITGNEIMVKLNEEEKIVKLISVKEKENTINDLEDIMKDIKTIYLEKDIKKESNNMILAYIWLEIPENNNVEKMLNYILIKNSFANFEMQPPNIKYNRFFTK